MPTLSEEPSSDAADSLTAGVEDATTVSSDAAAPAPPRRLRRRPKAQSAEAPPFTPSAHETEAEAVLVSKPLPFEGSFEERRPLWTEPGPAPVATPGPFETGPALSGPASSGARQVRQTIQKVDLWSVTKLSLCFYVSAMFVTLIALIALWIIADAAGIIDSVEKFMNDILSAKDFTFLSASVLRGTILVGLVIVALQVVITVIAASFYNIFAELFGGIEITVKEEEI